MRCARERCREVHGVREAPGFTGIMIYLCLAHRDQVLNFEYRALCALEAQA